MTIRVQLQRFLVIITFVLATTVSAVAQKPVQVPEVTYLKSSLGDYLYFLFNRKEYKAIPRLDSILGTHAVPRLGALIALPEMVASAQIQEYNDIYPILETYYKNTRATLVATPHPKRLSFSHTYPSYDTILSIVKSGAAYYPAFLELWKERVAPLEQQQIDAWKRQLAEKQVLEAFYRVTRLTLKTKRLEIAAMAYHLAGSANYSPAGIYTSLFREPNLPWVVGHEGTHLLLSGPVGAEWMKRPQAKALAQLAERKGETLYEIEENTCHFLQAMLSKICGTEDSSYVIHQPYPQGFRRDMLANMEKQWSAYLDGKEDLVAFMMRVAEETLKPMPDKEMKAR